MLNNYESLKYIIQRICSSAQVYTMPCRGTVISNRLGNRILNFKKKYKDISTIIILSDLDRRNCEKIVQDIRKKLSELKQSQIIIQIAIQEIEAWYLAMPEIIEKAFPNLKPFPKTKYLTDSITNPKGKLKDIFWDKLKRKYRETSDGPKIASNFKYIKNNQYQNKSFNRFIRKITSIA